MRPSELVCCVNCPWRKKVDGPSKLLHCVTDRWRGGGFFKKFCGFSSQGNINQAVDGPLKIESHAALVKGSHWHNQPGNIYWTVGSACRAQIGRLTMFIDHAELKFEALCICLLRPFGGHHDHKAMKIFEIALNTWRAISNSTDKNSLYLSPLVYRFIHCHCSLVKAQSGTGTWILDPGTWNWRCQ